MAEHKFRIGQLVTVARTPFSTAAGQYQITKLLPHDGQSFRYRVKSRNENHERVSAEHELAPLDV